MKRRHAFKVGDIVEYVHPQPQWAHLRGAVGLVERVQYTPHVKPKITVAWLIAGPELLSKYNHVEFDEDIIKPFIGEVPDAEGQDKGKV